MSQKSIFCITSSHTRNAEEIIAAKNIFSNTGAQDICPTGEMSPKKNKSVQPIVPRTNPALTATVMRSY